MLPCVGNIAANPEYIEIVNWFSQSNFRILNAIGGMRCQARFAGALLLFAFLIGPVVAQSVPLTPIPSVAKRPDPMTFAPWREVDQTEDESEYLEEFPSPIVSPYPTNNVVPLRIFLPANASGPLPVVLVLHYWGAVDLKNERAMAQELNRANIAAAVMTLPYHLGRTPPGRRSGDMAIEPDPRSLVATMTQAVLDTRRSIDFLESRPEFDHRRVGLAGTSLGAVVAALTYAVDERITHVTFILGGVNLAHIVWDSSLLVRQRDVLRRRGFSEEKLRDAIESIEPLKYLSTRKPTSSLVIGGQYDTVIPKRSTEELIESLTAPKVLWLDTGHYGGIFVQRRLMREVAKYFEAEFAGGSFTVPKNLYAPTIRIGVKVDTGNGFDLGVGLDLLKFDKKGDRFTTLFLTPKGLQLFLGQTVFTGLSFGVIGSSNKIGVGVLWSAVL